MSSTRKEYLPLLSDLEMSDRVIRTVAAHLGLRHNELSPNSHLRDDLHADFLDRIELAVTVEEQFGVRLPLEGSMRVGTVGDLVSMLKRAMGETSLKTNTILKETMRKEQNT
jgi:acyl carrier protein